MDSLTKLKLAIIAQVRAQVPVQAMWAECRSADRAKGTMVAVVEGLEVDDVLLGLGTDITVPEPGSRVLIGIIGNQREACFLLFAERIEARHLNGDRFGGVVKADDVADGLNKLAAELNELKTILTAWTPVAGDGGAVLKGAVSTWAGQPIAPVVSQELQNLIVSHG